MTDDWRQLSVEALEPIYNPRVAVADPQRHLDEFARSSAAARAMLGASGIGEEDVRYGPAALEILDLYRPAIDARPIDGAAMVLFIHGGFWRGLDKRDHSFVVPPLLDAGAVVANVNYDLCPAISLDTMVEQIVRAVRFCHGQARAWGADPDRLILIGHSAGAHLAASVLNHAGDAAGRPGELVAAMAAISGIYEPEIVTRISVNEQARIDTATARRHDCLSRLPGGHARIVAWAGGDEPAGWIAQTERYSEVVRSAGMSCQQFTLAGTNHFTVLQRSMQADSTAFGAIRRLMSD